MNYTLKTVVRVIAILLLSPSISAQNESIEKEIIQKIDSLFNSYHQHDQTGSVMSIIKKEKTVYMHHRGLANIEHQIPITSSTAFNIASVSKQFTSFLALLLEQEGKLSFDDDIRQYLPEFTHLPNKITIKQLTNHTHGLPNPDELALLKGIKTMNHQQVAEMLLNIKQVNFEAGTKHEYNNTGYILLSEIIERVGQKPFKEQLHEKIFKPLGMNNTIVVDNKNIVVKNKAYSYDVIDNTYINYPVRLSTIGSSGIFTTISDLGLWVKNYQMATLGTHEFYKKMQTVTVLNSGKKTNYGLGLQSDNYKGIDVVFHGGGTESYRSYILHAPEHQLSLLFLSNKGGMLGLDVLYKSLEIILKESIQETHTYKKLNNKELKKLEGTYEMFPGTYYNIIVEKEKLYFQEFGKTDKAYLPQIGENTFDFPIPHFKFIFYKDGFNFHIADMTYPCTKTVIELPKSKDVNLNNFIGIYKNTSHNTSYELVVRDNKLIAIHDTINYDITLKPLGKNSFYTKEPFLGKIDFIFNNNRTIKAFMVSGQNLKNVIFKKRTN